MWSPWALQRAGPSVQTIRIRLGPPSRLIQGQLWSAGQRAFSFHSTCKRRPKVDRTHGQQAVVGQLAVRGIRKDLNLLD